MAQMDRGGAAEGTGLTIGKQIAKYRKLEGWSAQKLAAEAGLTRSVIANIENGRRGDVTVGELLSISEALGVPAAALMYEIDKPMAPAPGPLPRDGRLDVMRPRVIDVVESLNASGEEWDQEVQAFYKTLEEVGGVVLYPVGITISPTYGKAGRQARALLNSARVLVRAFDRVDKCRGDLLVLVREVWPYSDDRERTDQFDDMAESGSLFDSKVADDFRSSVSSEDRQLFDELARALDAAVRNLRDVQNQFALLGGDPSAPSFSAFSPRTVMGMVKSMPHEFVTDVEARGGLGDNAPASPLREHRSERLEKLRARFRNRGVHGEHPEAPER